MSKNAIRGITVMVIAQVIFTMAWVGLKYLGANLPLFEIIFFRAAFSMVVLIPLIHLSKSTYLAKNWLTLFLRSLFGTAALALFLHAMIDAGMGNAASLFNTMPIFVALMAPVLLGEKFIKLQFIFILIAFAGVALIVRPNSDILGSSAIFALIAGVFAAMAMICLRKLGATDDPLIVTFYFTAFIAVVSLPVMIWKFVMPSPHEWLILAISGTSLGFAQLLMTYAYKLGRASSVAPFTYLFVVGSYFSGIVVFDEMPDMLSIIGALVIIIAGVAIMLASPRDQRCPGSTPGMRA